MPKPVICNEGSSKCLAADLAKGPLENGSGVFFRTGPSTLMVEPTNVCNLHCPACPTGAGILNRPPRAMSFDEFKGILNQALDPPGYLRRVTLFNYGEPFLCKDLLRMVRYAADRGLETFTSTNGQFLGGGKIATRWSRAG